MKRSADSSRWVFHLTVAFLFGTVLLRSLLLYQDSLVLGQVLGLLTAWLVLFIGEMAIFRRWPRVFPIYLLFQTVLVSVFLWRPHFPEYDYFASLFAILSMQVMQRLILRLGAIWLGSCTLLMALPMVTRDGLFEGIALTLVYTAVTDFFCCSSCCWWLSRRSRRSSHVASRQPVHRWINLYRLAPVRVGQGPGG